MRCLSFWYGVRRSSAKGDYTNCGPLSLYLQVENQLFKVHRHFLIRESPVFQWMFACPPRQDGPDGVSDQRPIPLPGVLSREFEALLDFFYRG